MSNQWIAGSLGTATRGTPSRADERRPQGRMWARPMRQHRSERFDCPRRTGVRRRCSGRFSTATDSLGLAGCVART